MKTSTSSFKYVPSDTIGVSKVVATRTGILDASSSEQASNANASARKKQAGKQSDTMIDVVPLHSSKYQPREGDLVIGTVVSRNAEFFSVDINSSTHAVLNSLEFQGATRRDKPKYEEGTLVICRVLSCDKLAKTQLTCISSTDKKAWNSGEAELGELGAKSKLKVDQGVGIGFVKDFPIRFCKELIQADETQTETNASAYLLNRLRAKLQSFELKVGSNGKVWIKGRMSDTVFILNAFERCVSTDGDKAEIDRMLSVLR